MKTIKELAYHITTTSGLGGRTLTELLHMTSGYAQVNDIRVGKVYI